MEERGMNEFSESDEIVLDEPWREPVQRRLTILSVAPVAIATFLMAAQAIG
jgi:hypothetical protein